MNWKVVVDIAPRTIEGTNGCHEFVYGYYKTKGEAQTICDQINTVDKSSTARVEYCESL